MFTLKNHLIREIESVVLKKIEEMSSFRIPQPLYRIKFLDCFESEKKDV